MSITRFLPHNQSSFVWLAVKALRLIKYTRAPALLSYFLGKQGGVWLPIKPYPGLKLYCRRHTSDIRVLYGALAREEFDLGLSHKPTCIVDAGANVGITTAIFATLFPNAQIFAIEPDRENIQSLKKNCSAFPNVELFEAALWPESTILHLQDDSVPHWARQVGQEGTGPSFPTITMGELVAKSKSGRISVLKMDIEGAEENMFSSPDLSWLDSVDCLSIEVHSSKAKETVINGMKSHFSPPTELGEKLYFKRAQ